MREFKFTAKYNYIPTNSEINPQASYLYVNLINDCDPIVKAGFNSLADINFLHTSVGKLYDYPALSSMSPAHGGCPMNLVIAQCNTFYNPDMAQPSFDEII